MGDQTRPSKRMAVLAALVLGGALGLTACDGGTPSARQSTPASERSVERPSATGSREAERTPSRSPSLQAERSPSREAERSPSREAERTTKPAETAEPTKTTEPAKRTETTEETRTTTPAETDEETTPAEAAPPPRTSTATTTPASSTSAVPAAAESQGLGPWGWLLVLALLTALIVGGLLIYRTQRRSAWDTEARALESETRTVTAVRLPPVLSATIAAQRALAWPPVRAGLTDQLGRWTTLAERAPGEARQTWALRIGGLLQQLLTAVEAENQALATGQDWMLFRPQVNQAEQALAAALSAQPQPEPPAAGEPGPTAFQT